MFNPEKGKNNKNSNYWKNQTTLYISTNCKTIDYISGK